MASETARFALSCPTMCCVRSLTISEGVWCWCSLLDFCGFGLVSAGVVAVVVDSDSASSGVLILSGADPLLVVSSLFSVPVVSDENTRLDLSKILLVLLRKGNRSMVILYLYVGYR